MREVRESTGASRNKSLVSGTSGFAHSSSHGTVLRFTCGKNVHIKIVLSYQVSSSFGSFLPVLTLYRKVGSHSSRPRALLALVCRQTDIQM